MTNALIKQEDATILRYIADKLSYNGSEGEAKIKHQLYEIAMRIETDFYSKQEPKKVPALLKPPYVVT